MPQTNLKKKMCIVTMFFIFPNNVKWFSLHYIYFHDQDFKTKIYSVNRTVKSYTFVCSCHDKGEYTQHYLSKKVNNKRLIIYEYVTQQLNKIWMFHLFHNCSLFQKIFQCHCILLKSLNNRQILSLNKNMD